MEEFFKGAFGAFAVIAGIALFIYALLYLGSLIGNYIILVILALIVGVPVYLNKHAGEG